MPRRKRHQPARTSDETTEPFSDSEQAWFWFVRCQRLRDEGARFVRDASRVRRPCDPDDIYRVVTQMLRARQLGRQHADTLVRFGNLERAPDPRLPAERADDIVWRDALQRLTHPLSAKGIVRNDDLSDDYRTHGNQA